MNLLKNKNITEQWANGVKSLPTKCSYIHENGERVTVTEVNEVGRPPVGKWNDLVYLGRVRKGTDIVSNLV